jgi:tetratricopeptide (TPR) repeat protein
LTNAALDTALGLEPQPLTAKRSILKTVGSAYLSSGIDAAIRRYETLRKLRPDAYNFDVGQLNGLARYLIEKGHPGDAIRIFQLNLQSYPASADSYDGMGDAYERGGNREMAIRSYEKALELDPRLTHAGEALVRLRNRN